MKPDGRPPEMMDPPGPYRGVRDETGRRRPSRFRRWLACSFLHEWKCPNCGATTRARMADQ